METDERPFTPTSPRELAPFIDHTLLAPQATPEDVVKLCRQAVRYGFAAVCVNSCYVPLAAQELSGKAPKVCCVAGFPLGASLTEAKAFEAREAVRLGANEIDMVMNLGAYFSGDHDACVSDMATVIQAASPAQVKVILETGLLDDEQTIKACILAKAAGAAFVKTCTGFGPGRATPGIVRLMRSTVGRDVGVKASGGIRTLEQGIELVRSGADRLGTSSGVKIVNQCQIASILPNGRP